MEHKDELKIFYSTLPCTAVYKFDAAVPTAAVLVTEVCYSNPSVLVTEVCYSNIKQVRVARMLRTAPARPHAAFLQLRGNVNSVAAQRAWAGNPETLQSSACIAMRPTCTLAHRIVAAGTTTTPLLQGQPA